MNNKEIILFNDKKNCCNCTACKNICPKDAIYMHLDEYGFEYPKINRKKCISCGLCNKVCAFQNIKENNKPIETYVAVSKDDKVLLESASGGIFTTIAQIYLRDGGVVFGATFDDDFNPIHIGISKIQDLYKLQGSKYVQSSIGNTYKEAKQFLNSGKKVLFSGTPCQIAGLKGYLMKDYDNLLTIDIICHGVPSLKFFKDYLQVMEQKIKGKIKKFNFRDKSIGWGLNGSILYENNGILKKKKIYGSESSYYHYFLNSSCYRENCYHCKYACENRPADITIGDYWGIEVAHPELLGKGKIEEEKGISVVIVNTLKGKEEIEDCDNLKKFNSNFSKARIKNGQLNKPSKKGLRYQEVMNEYKNGGYIAVEKLYNREVGIKRYKSRIKCIIPNNIKKIIKKHM